MYGRTSLAVAGLIVLGASPASAGDDGGPASGAKTWIERYAAYEEYLRTAPIEKIQPIGQGVTNPDCAFFAPGGLAARAVVKVLPRKRQNGYWESHESEVAAYELDRILGLDMVPVTVERRIRGDRASVQLWVPGTRHLSDIASETPGNPFKWARQVRRQRVFDALVANIDRNAGNLLVDDEWNLILIDHSRAFVKNETPFLEEITAVDRPLYEALKALDEATLDERLGPWLFGKSSVRDLLERRDKIVKRLEELAEQRGDAAVFPP